MATSTSTRPVIGASTARYFAMTRKYTPEQITAMFDVEDDSDAPDTPEGLADPRSVPGTVAFNAQQRLGASATPAGDGKYRPLYRPDDPLNPKNDPLHPDRPVLDRVAAVGKGIVDTTVGGLANMASTMSKNAKYDALLPGLGGAMNAKELLLDPAIGEFKKSVDPARSTPEQLGHLAAGLLPAIGPAAASVGEEFGRDPYRAGGQIIGGAATAAAPALVRAGTVNTGPLGRGLQRSGMRTLGKALGANELQLESLTTAPAGQTPPLASVLDRGDIVSGTRRGLRKRLDRNKASAGKSIAEKEARIPENAMRLDPEALLRGLDEEIARVAARDDNGTILLDDAGNPIGKTSTETTYINNLIERRTEMLRRPELKNSIDIRRSYDESVDIARGFEKRQSGKDIPMTSPAYAQRTAAGLLRDQINQLTPDIVPDRRAIGAYSDALDVVNKKLAESTLPKSVIKAIGYRIAGHGAGSITGLLQVTAAVDLLTTFWRWTGRRTAMATLKYKIGKMLEAGDLEGAAASARAAMAHEQPPTPGAPLQRALPPSPFEQFGPYDDQFVRVSSSGTPGVPKVGEGPMRRVGVSPDGSGMFAPVRDIDTGAGEINLGQVRPKPRDPLARPALPPAAEQPLLPPLPDEGFLRMSNSGTPIVPTLGAGAMRRVGVSPDGVEVFAPIDRSTPLDRQVLPSPLPPEPVSPPPPPMPVRTQGSAATPLARPRTAIPGMEPDPIPAEFVGITDPIVRNDLLGRPGVFGWIKSVPEREAIYSRLPSGARVMSAGEEAAILSAPDGNVIRISRTDRTTRPNIPEVLQPISSEQIGNWTIETLPRVEPFNRIPHSGVDPAPIPEAELSALQASIRGKGYDFWDVHPGNIGRTADGRLVVIDGGAVEPMRAATASTSTPATATASPLARPPAPAPAPTSAASTGAPKVDPSIRDPRYVDLVDRARKLSMKGDWNGAHQLMLQADKRRQQLGSSTSSSLPGTDNNYYGGDGSEDEVTDPRRVDFGLGAENDEFIRNTPPHQIYPKRFKSARTVTMAMLLEQPERGDPVGVWGEAFDPRDEDGHANMAVLTREAAYSPVTVHEIGHAIWGKVWSSDERPDVLPGDLTDTERHEWFDMVEAHKERHRARQAKTGVYWAESFQNDPTIPAAVKAYADDPRHSFAELAGQYIANPTKFAAMYPPEYAYFKKLFGGKEYKRPEAEPRSPLERPMPGKATPKETELPWEPRKNEILDRPNEPLPIGMPSGVRPKPRSGSPTGRGGGGGWASNSNADSGARAVAWRDSTGRTVTGTIRSAVPNPKGGRAAYFVVDSVGKSRYVPADRLEGGSGKDSASTIPKLPAQQTSKIAEYATRSGASEWPADPSALDENDSIVMRRTAPSGKSAKYPTPILPRDILPEKFTNARKVDWATPITKTINGNPDAKGLYGGIEFDPAKAKTQQKTRIPAHAIRIAADAIEKPAVYVHESGHAAYEKDLTEADRARFHARFDDYARKFMTEVRTVNVKDRSAIERVMAKYPKSVVTFYLQYGLQGNMKAAYHEGFAETFAQYVLNPTAFKSRYPDLYDDMKAITGKEYIGAGKAGSSPLDRPRPLSETSKPTAAPANPKPNPQRPRPRILDTVLSTMPGPLVWGSSKQRNP